MCAAALVTIVSPAWADGVPLEQQSDPPAVSPEPQRRQSESQRPARAQVASSEQATAQIEKPKTRRRYYGWQLLITDGAAIGLVSARQYAAGVAMFAVGSPIVHMAHGNVPQFFGSVAARVVLPVGGAAAGAALETCTPGEWFCGLQGAALGGLVGLLAAEAIDHAWLAHDEVPVDDPAPTGVRAAYTPTVAVNAHGAAVGLSGTF
jgi:hypothetical protein